MALTSPRFMHNARLQAASENSPPMRKGERGDAVQLLQEAFVDQGFPMPITTKNGTREADGIFGSETQKTVWQFQAKHGLQRDGIAGRQTLTTLDALYAPVRPSAFQDRIKAQKLARWNTAH